MTDEQALDDTGSDWPLRPWLLAGMLGLAGLLIWLVTDGKDDDPVRMAGAAFLFFGPMAAAFSLERDSWKEAAIFALIAGLVMAGLAWRAVSGQELYADEEYGFAAGVVATVIALPLFQSGFHRTRFATPYRTIHFNAWTDAVSAAGSLAFLGLTWLMTLLLANLFQLLKIDFLMDLIDEGWFGWTLSGVAFGAALGVLRSKLGILGMLQHVVMLVLSLLAVPLALALVVFLGAMVVSGPDVLWEATRSATPILLACAAGAWVLTNAIVRDDDTEMSRNLVMRVTAFVLALSLLPLTGFAAVSMGTRIAAYGLSPERLWALVAIAVACSFGVAYLVVVVRGRLAGWRTLLRRANLNLAAGLSVVALFLALPILDFGSISAANQLARLERGAVKPEEFDFDALKWEFGKAGEKALAKLAASGNAEVAKLAKMAQTRLDRPDYWREPEDRQKFAQRIEVHPAGRELPAGLREAIFGQDVCDGAPICRVFLQEDGRTAAVIGDGCVPPIVTIEEQTKPGVNCAIDVMAFTLKDGKWDRARQSYPPGPKTTEEERASLQRERAAIERGDVTVGPSRQRVIYLGGKPESPTFD
jgi:hypothetical protein